MFGARRGRGRALHLTGGTLAGLTLSWGSADWTAEAHSVGRTVRETDEGPERVAAGQMEKS